MRTFIAALVGIMAGLAVAFALVEIIVATAVAEPDDLANHLPLAILVGFLPFILAIAGGIAGPLVARRIGRRRESAARP